MHGGPELRISPDIRPLIRVARIRIAPVVIGPAAPSLLGKMAEAERVLAERHAGRPPGAIEGLAAARALYRSFRIDPTRARPSSEALLRRVLQGKPLPRLLNAIDLCNLLSVRFLLPLGLYDEDKIEGPALLRRGLAGESYPGIRKDQIGLEGKPVLADSLGAFGNPTSDSLRTSVTPVTTRLWLVIFAPAAHEESRLREFAAMAREELLEHLPAHPGEAETDVLLLA